ncbi:MAG: response regulator transcription factor [Chloroflexi bacterium]|nr:response regulator transcription factor [Chloroflexota bacterium]
MKKRLRIIVADDQTRTRQSMKALFDTCPQIEEVIEAADGGEAFRLCAEWKPDLVLMDVRMPEIDGLASTRMIKAQMPQVRVIALSMYPEYQALALAAGADGFVAKGEPLERLLDLLVDIGNANSKEE